MWIEDILVQFQRTHVEITFDLHVFDRKDYRNLDLSKIEETVKTAWQKKGR